MLSCSFFLFGSITEHSVFLNTRFVMLTFFHIAKCAGMRATRASVN